jgi:hypothetical protein
MVETHLLFEEGETVSGLPSVHIENLSTLPDILESVKKWASWELASYPMEIAYRRGHHTTIHNESELQTWVEELLRS